MFSPPQTTWEQSLLAGGKGDEDKNASEMPLPIKQNNLGTIKEKELIMMIVVLVSHHGNDDDDNASALPCPLGKSRKKVMILIIMMPHHTQELWNNQEKGDNDDGDNDDHYALHWTSALPKPLWNKQARWRA